VRAARAPRDDPAPASDERQAAGLIDPDPALAPAARAAHGLPDRQAIQELVAKDDRRDLGVDVLDPVQPPRGVVGQRLGLAGPERAAGLQQHDVQRLGEAGRDTRSPQRIAHQSSIAGAELDQPQARRPAEAGPHFRRPQAQDFAEHLRDMGGGDEVTVGPESRPHRIITFLRIVQARIHVVVDGQGPFAPDALDEARQQVALFRRGEFTPHRR
jgi:hypothetical protein